MASLRVAIATCIANYKFLRHARISKHVLIIYNPPNSESNYQQKLLAYLSDNMQATEEVILLGDFNVPDINWATLSGSSDLSSKLCDLIFQHNYVQQVDHPTHIYGNILDLIITSSEDTVSGINITKEFNQAIKSDHYLIVSNFN